jgi:hypothetical protein
MTKTINGMKKLMSKYEMEYKLLPELVTYISLADSLDLLTDPENWLYAAEMHDATGFEFDLSEIGVEVREEGEEAFVIYTFPKPDKEPLAKYGVVIVKQKKTPDETFYDLEGYYTLEMSHDATFWFVGCNKPGIHSNCGIIEGEPGIDEFLKRIKEMRRLIAAVGR